MKSCEKRGKKSLYFFCLLYRNDSMGVVDVSQLPRKWEKIFNFYFSSLELDIYRNFSSFFYWDSFSKKIKFYLKTLLTKPIKSHINFSLRKNHIRRLLSSQSHFNLLLLLHTHTHTHTSISPNYHPYHVYSISTLFSAFELLLFECLHRIWSEMGMGKSKNFSHCWCAFLIIWKSFFSPPSPLLCIYTFSTLHSILRIFYSLVCCYYYYERRVMI